MPGRGSGNKDKTQQSGEVRNGARTDSRRAPGGDRGNGDVGSDAGSSPGHDHHPDPVYPGSSPIIGLTPPFGFALFYMKGAAPGEVGMTQIYRGVVPFVVLQLVALILVLLFPEIAMTLPGMLQD